VLTGTIDELRSVALAAEDASGHFPAMYARITHDIETAAAAGRFADASRMERFAEAFAHWYPRLRHDGAPVPGCWRASFDVAGDSRLMIVQHLLLGINAHVNHDLPQVVVALAPRGSDLAALRPDFDSVNDILAESLPTVLRSLGTVSRWVNTAAVLGGGRLFDFSLQVARRQAWDAAGRMHALDDTGRAEYAAELDRLVRVLAYMLVHPGPVSSVGVALGRRCEDHDPRDVTRKLLGPVA
jgi:hypothetical protein